MKNNTDAEHRLLDLGGRVIDPPAYADDLDAETSRYCRAAARVKMRHALAAMNGVPLDDIAACNATKAGDANGQPLLVMVPRRLVTGLQGLLLRESVINACADVAGVDAVLGELMGL